ncbi:hypothetical protein RQP46_003438 [Phenoliferia psychrophenolica]
MTLTVAILTVSDTAFTSSTDVDKSGPALRSLLSSVANSPFNIVSSAIVPDEPTEITRVVSKWCEAGINLVLTTGGTGFGVRDRTPEALAPLITKPAPGLVHLMLSSSLRITPLAALSRPVAGVAVSPSSTTGRGTMIISLPGSPKGATENLQCLLEILPHAIDLATGGSGRSVHEQLEEGRRGRSGSVKEGAEVKSPEVVPTAVVKSHEHHHHSHSHSHAGHSHSHGHAAPTPRTVLSLDPSSAATRQRHSPYPLVPVRDALSLIFKHTYVTPVQSINLSEDLVGHVLAEDVAAAHAIPKLPTTNVDGYAVRSTDPIGTYKVVLSYPTSPLPAGSIYRINTGAPLPPGADAVVMVEDTEVVSRLGTEGEEDTVKILAQVDKGENVRAAGSDVKEGEKVLEEGDVISGVGGELGTLAFVGRRSAAVHRRPVVAVLSTGSELVSILDTRRRPPSSSPSSSSPPQSESFSSIPDSNRPALLSILKHLHFDTLDLGIVGDSMDETKAALKKGKEEADIIITTGGTSMGVGDLLKPCIEREMGGTVHFGRVAMKPGKPTTFATLPAHPMAPAQEAKLVFALPGNPASALVTFFVFVLPALRKMEGRLEAAWELPRVMVQRYTDEDG